MGPGPVFTACVGHLLLLHLEGRKIHWKGKHPVVSRCSLLRHFFIPLRIQGPGFYRTLISANIQDMVMLI